MLDFTPTEEQLMMQKMARDFAQKEVKPYAMVWDKIPDPAKAFCADATRKSFKLDFHKMTVAKQYGGLGMDCLTHCLVWEEFAVADGGFALGHHANGIVSSIVQESASEAQRKEFLGALMAGEGGWCASAMTEPNVGPSGFFADVNNMQLTATARKVGNEYVLNGEKVFCTNAGSPFTKWVRVMAQTDKTVKGPKGMSCFYIWSDTPGFKVVKFEDKIGHRSSINAIITLDDCKVPLKYLENDAEGYNFAAGSSTKFSTVDGWTIIASLILGIARAAFEEAVNFAKQRIILGRPQIELQLVGGKLADMFIDIEATRALVWKAAWEADHNKLRNSKQAYAAKIMASDVAARTTSEACQIFGGVGITKDALVEKLFRDAKMTQIYEGANEPLRVNLAKRMQYGM